jgi:hypothetical protein
VTMTSGVEGPLGRRRIMPAANSGIQRNDKTTNLSCISHSMHGVSTLYNGRGATERSILVHKNKEQGAR